MKRRFVYLLIVILFFMSACSPSYSRGYTRSSYSSTNYSYSKPSKKSSASESKPKEEEKKQEAIPQNLVSEEEEITVYITKTGKKYHTESCSYLRESKIAISLEDAKSNRYEPCSRCNPPK